MTEQWIVGLAGASGEEEEAWYVRTQDCSPVQVMTTGTDVCWCANEEMANRIATLPALEARIEKLERGIKLAKVHFGNAESTKAERMLDIAMREPE